MFFYVLLSQPHLLHHPDKKNAKGEVGIVRGLAWTQAGGDTLEIEVITMPGKGEFKLTGNMGDVIFLSDILTVFFTVLSLVPSDVNTPALYNSLTAFLTIFAICLSRPLTPASLVYEIITVLITL